MEERFRDNGDGTVTDACTGLMWQQRTADITGDGGSTAEDGATWQDALRYCDGLTLAGHDDWRLPSTRELESIVDYGRRDPCIGPAFETVARPHWTSSSLVPAGDLVDQPHTAGFVDFRYGGHLYHSPKMMPTRHVRAVRTAF